MFFGSAKASAARRFFVICHVFIDIGAESDKMDYVNLRFGCVSFGKFFDSLSLCSRTLTRSLHDKTVAKDAAHYIMED